MKNIHYRTGDIFTSDAEALVNPVNCVGVSGKGLAKTFAKRYPQTTLVYEQLCRDKELVLGCPRMISARDWDRWTLFIVLFPTKSHWKQQSELKWIEIGLRQLRSTLCETGIVDIAIPKIGCGEGGLDWCDVRPLIEKYLGGLETIVYVYE